MSPNSHARSLKIAGVVAILFGVMTVLSGGTALFGGKNVEQAVGDVVPFVLWFNFLAGFFYVLAGVGLMLRRNWAVRLSGAILSASIVVLALLVLHVMRGGLYETRTLGAMVFRCVVWLALFGAAKRGFGRATPF